ncbi:hypothetical protein C5467_23605 [Photorhabdus khanii subsp. guanajuatensis]|uniref:Uncharacterized protein n=1 Tax=Photorhabdus khanii subsp. guanajuatensis TaxID=2100166 RepID=A0A4R4IQ10_9GAMM|nr:hypothetical protein C5467_23605 [Photorhabdus khanii subsp. guanajuatensis]
MNIKECSETLCKHLMDSCYQSEAEEISRLVNILLDNYTNEDEKMKATSNLLSRCHPRWLGDYYIKDVTYKYWTDLITKFRILLKKMHS